MGDSVLKRVVAVSRETVAGAVGGTCLVLVGHPLDTIKVRLQTSNQYSGAIDCFTRTLKADGIRGLYRGMVPPLLTVTPMLSLCFMGYGFGKDLVRSSPDEKLSIFKTGIAGAVAGVFCVVVMAPGERVKTLLQTQDPKNPKYSGTFDCIRKLYASAGVRGIYQGSAATLLRDIPATFAYFATYEAVKRSLSNADGTLNTGAILMAGGLAGVVHWIIGIPPDVIKSVIQAAPPGKYSGVGQAVQEIIAERGIRGLYRGVGPVLLRAFPANAASFLGIETTYKALDYLSNRL